MMCAVLQAIPCLLSLMLFVPLYGMLLRAILRVLDHRSRALA